MPIKVVFIQYNAPTTGAGSFTVPADFGSLISVEAIGGGAYGGVATNAGGGGGGAYAKTTAITSSATWIPGQTQLFYRVGRGGNSTGGLISLSTWFNADANLAPTLSTQGVLAQPGNAGNAGAGGAGGIAGTSIGSVVFAGGAGGSPGGTNNLGGGGGAGGPGGTGGTAGTGSATLNQGSGGGGSGATLTAAGTAGQTGQAAAGGAGGASTGQTGGSGATSLVAANNTTPANGGGGGGGFATTNTAGGGGSAGNYWRSTSLWNGTTLSSSVATGGSGGGGGGGGTGGTGGGLYGGGGGGVTTGQTSLGGNGIIVFTYNYLDAPMARLTNTGTLYLNANSLVTSKINEVTVSTMRMNPSNFYANFFDEINGPINITGGPSVSSSSSPLNTFSDGTTLIGDLLMVFLGSDTGLGTFTVPSGWTAVENANGKAVMYRYADANGATPYTFSNSSAAVVDSYLFTFRNAAYDTTGGVDGPGTTSITAPSVNVTRGIAIVLAHFVTSGETGDTYSSPGGLESNPSVGFTLLGQNFFSTGLSSALFYCRVPYNGATGAVTTTVSPGTSAGVGSLFSIIPAGSMMQVTSTGTVFVGQFIDESTDLGRVTQII